MLSDPLHQLPAIGPIDPEQAELFAGPTQPGKEESSASWIGHRSGGDDHSHEQYHAPAWLLKLGWSPALPSE